MEIKTKYNIGDWVWFGYSVFGEEPSTHNGRIDAISIDVKESNSDILIYYHIKEFEDGIGITLPEEEVFPIFSTKEELLKSL